MLAAAFVRGDFESGSDSKSGLFVAEVCAHIDVHRVGQRLDVLSFFVFLFYTVNLHCEFDSSAGGIAEPFRFEGLERLLQGV